MATIKIHNGEAHGVYDDRWRVLFDALGALQVQRATEVEFEPATQEWVATHLDSGLVIARGRNRADVIRAEVEWLETNVIGR